jgi:hypothetical protein
MTDDPRECNIMIHAQAAVQYHGAPALSTQIPSESKVNEDPTFEFVSHRYSFSKAHGSLAGKAAFRPRVLNSQPLHECLKGEGAGECGDFFLIDLAEATVWLSPIWITAWKTGRELLPIHGRYLDLGFHSLETEKGDRCAQPDLQRTRLEKHPHKTDMGRIEKGFDFLGYHFSPQGLSLADKTVENFLEKARRINAQKSPLSAKSELSDYVKRWCSCAYGGLAPLPNGRECRSHQEATEGTENIPHVPFRIQPSGFMSKSRPIETARRIKWPKTRLTKVLRSIGRNHL